MCDVSSIFMEQAEKIKGYNFIFNYKQNKQRMLNECVFQHFLMKFHLLHTLSLLFIVSATFWTTFPRSSKCSSDARGTALTFTFKLTATSNWTMKKLAVE